MSSGFAFEWDKKKWQKFIKRVQWKLSKSEIDGILSVIAQKGVATLKSKMPQTPKVKGFLTGETANRWFTIKKGDGSYSIFNTSKVALFLEEGTKAHGPKTAKFLYIPLRANARVWRKGLVFGRDFILVKWVKGIDAMHYLTPASHEILEDMVNRFTLHLVQI